ncbi:MAG: hypothetical protein E1N59_623 [Puniceicoccaceae bacterium 5H]|nr:MAG: hypothetical protein E1N59_623 [Puniceicoccaceae bacterium 5H]
MTRKDLLKNIAITGYNVGFGAKRHFATLDIIDKVPGTIGVLSTAIGVFALVFDILSAKWLSALFIVLGHIGTCISIFDHQKEMYDQAGKELTQKFHDLRRLYYSANALEEDDAEGLAALEANWKEIEKKCGSIGISKQILLSGWYAHLKFFGESHIDWVDEELHFKFWKDKIPASLYAWVFLVVACGLGFLIWVSISALEVSA